ncbi:MAG: hypothetical protein RMM17_07620 [Acidobacteriota bacterium]|nr:hypothetical protein [Blastocatellia bacterium]MDW8412534.1 hypothetical protein [Acidobacteriota bacterium]
MPESNLLETAEENATDMSISVLCKPSPISRLKERAIEKSKICTIAVNSRKMMIFQPLRSFLGSALENKIVDMLSIS